MKQRELKFRAFDDGKMLTMPLDTNFGISRFFGILRDDAILMQFTGLKDKNGIEIYEGDFVKIGGLVELVKYLDGILISYNPNIYGHPVKIYVEDFENFIVTSSDYFEPYEIIGNIYQNADILTLEK